MIFWLSQVFFVCAIISYFFAVSRKKKIFMSLCFVVTNVFFALHYLCLEKYSTLFLLANEIVLLIVLAILEKYKLPQKYTIITCVAVLCLHIIAIVVTWTEAISLIPFSASIVFLFSLLFRGVLVTKICTLYTNTAYIIYLALIGSYVAIVCQCILLIGATMGLVVTIKDIKTKKQIIQSRLHTSAILQKVKLKPAHTKEEKLFSNK